jgi:two-component system, OmpR family, sensor histidine kinase VicK
VVASAALSNARLYQTVAEEKERSSAILLHIADGIVAVDRDECIVLWNATAEQVTGVPASEALGRTVREVLQRDLTGAEPRSGAGEQITITRGGKDVFLSVAEAVMLDAAGNVAGRIFAFRDVSSERMLDQMKSDFVATVSHELRTPLTSIYGFAETLLRRDIEFSEPERSTFLGYIASESERLIGIVDDLLNVARLEAGTLGLSLRPTDVGEIVASVAERARDALGDGARVAVDVDVPEGSFTADADPEKLAQILQQLVDNAIKFSPEGGTITLTGRRRADSIEVRVSDEGIGIPHADQQRIFTKFYRAEAGPSAPGTGLGLFLVRGLLAAMGGRISVESTEGQGSTFAFELPVSKRAPRGRQTPVEAGRP